MKQLLIDDVVEYVEDNIGAFHTKRLEKLEKLKLNQILKRKNPYLFKAKNILTPQDLVQTLLDTYLSSQEETIFGNFLEGVAIFVCNKVYGGFKSSLEGVDLEFEKTGVKYIVEIKSGPNWGNSSQIKRMKTNFEHAKMILKKQYPNLNVLAVNGCCYGQDRKPDKGMYLKLCGQVFWEFISGNEDLYTDIIEPLGYNAKKKNESFYEAYVLIISRFTWNFMQDFCDDGIINWEKLVQFNSSKPE